MGGTDQMGRSIAEYRVRLCNYKWWWHVIAHLMSASVSSAWILYRGQVRSRVTRFWLLHSGTLVQQGPKGHSLRAEGPQPEARRAEAGVAEWGFWGGAASCLLRQLRELGERCDLFPRGPGQSPGCPTIFYILSALMGSPSTLCLKLKNTPNIFRCNPRKHCRIFIMFSTLVTEKVSNQ